MEENRYKESVQDKPGNTVTENTRVAEKERSSVDQKESILQKIASPQWCQKRSIVLLAFAILASLPLLLQMFMPLCVYETADVIYTLKINAYFASVNHANSSVASFALLQLGLMLILIF